MLGLMFDVLSPQWTGFATNCANALRPTSPAHLDYRNYSGKQPIHLLLPTTQDIEAICPAYRGLGLNRSRDLSYASTSLIYYAGPKANSLCLWRYEIQRTLKKPETQMYLDTEILGPHKWDYFGDTSFIVVSVRGISINYHPTSFDVNLLSRVHLLTWFVSYRTH